MIVLALAIFVCVLMPLYVVHLAWTSHKGGRLAWLLKVLGALGFMGFLTLIARWDFLSVYLVWFWWALVLLASVLGLFTVWNRRWLYGEKRGTLMAIALEPIVGFLLLGYVVFGFLHGGGAVELNWPLANGRFYVGQGGNNPMLNYHNAFSTQRYALDVVALDGLGRRADGIQPAELEEYVIYGAEIVAPCAGNVIEVLNDIPDNAIETTNVDEPAGNRIVIACNGIEVVLAHLQPGTAAVAIGDTVAVGQPLGRVGNSGNSTEPHLHVHAVKQGTGGHADGEAVPLTFGGVFPARNTIIEG